MKRPPKKPATDRSFVIALSRGLDVLRAFHPNDGLLGNQELAARTKLPKPTVSRLTYTAQVLNESLRLCPPAAGVGRTATQDIMVDGYRVEAGSIVAIGISAVHRDPTLWDHPLAFDPDRFSPENSKIRDRWQFIPFAAGPRSCIGEHFAMLVTTLALALATGWLYAAVALVAGVWFLVMAHQLYSGVKRGEPVKPLRLFLQSNNYLAVVFCALAVDSALALPMVFGR